MMCIYNFAYISIFGNRYLNGVSLLRCLVRSASNLPLSFQQKMGHRLRNAVQYKGDNKKIFHLKISKAWNRYIYMKFQNFAPFWLFMKWKKRRLKSRESLGDFQRLLPVGDQRELSLMKKLYPFLVTFNQQLRSTKSTSLKPSSTRTDTTTFLKSTQPNGLVLCTTLICDPRQVPNQKNQGLVSFSAFTNTPLLREHSCGQLLVCMRVVGMIHRVVFGAQRNQLDKLSQYW